MSPNELMQHALNQPIARPMITHSMPEQPKALRYNQGKLKWSYVHFKSLEPMVRALMAGAEKYVPENWKKGLDKKEILESMQRHLAALMDGELVDPENGILHTGGIMCNAMFYTYFHNLDQAKKDDSVG